MSAAPPRFRTDVVVFDLDGVLIDSEQVNVGSAVAAFRRFGRELPPRAGERIVGRHPVDYAPELAREVGLDPDVLPDLLRYQDELYRARWRDEVRAIPGAAETVETLRRRGFRLALATSAGRAHAAACLDRFGWRPAFEVVVSKDDVSRRKPHPEVYVRALAAMTVATAVAVEDTAHGVTAARAAGLSVLAVRSEAVPAARIAHADRVLERIVDVADAVERIAGGTPPPRAEGSV